MDNLTCNEEEEEMMSLMMSPHDHKIVTAIQISQHLYNNNTPCANITYTNKQDCEEAFKMYMAKENNYMPQPGYVEFLQSDEFIRKARCNAIHWLIQSLRRLNLSAETVSNAANYLDRFISIRKCQEWKYWMMELLSVACLSTASKFGETAPPSLHEIQVEGLEYTFAPRLIQEMELKLLQALDWKLNSPTPYSYLELMTWDTDNLFVKPFLFEDLLPQLKEMFLFALLDCKMIAFRPSVIAVCLLRSVLEKLIIPTKSLISHFTHFSTLIPEYQRDDLHKCHEIMICQELLDQYLYDKNVLASDQLQPYPTSPVTVLNRQCDRQVDCSDLIKMPSFSKPYKKRKRIDQQH